MMSTQKRPDNIVISIRTTIETDTISLGKNLLEIFCARSLLRPEIIGHHDQDNWAFMTPNAISNHWTKQHDIDVYGKTISAVMSQFWKRKSAPEYTCYFKHSCTSIYGNWIAADFKVYCEYNDAVDYQNFFEDLCTLLKPQLGMLHLFTDNEPFQTAKGQFFHRGIFGTPEGEAGPRGFGWMFAAGNDFYERTMEPIVDDIGVVRKDYSDYCTLQIAQDDNEIINDFGAFSQRRQKLIERLPMIIPDMTEKEMAWLAPPDN